MLIAEDEKDADCLTQLGYLATTCPGDPSKWHKLDPATIEHFRAREVAIVPDNDGPGRKHAEQVARSLAAVAATVKVVDLRKVVPDLPEKGDAADFIQAGHGEAEIDALIADAAEWRDPAARPGCALPTGARPPTPAPCRSSAGSSNPRSRSASPACSPRPAGSESRPWRCSSAGTSPPATRAPASWAVS